MWVGVNMALASCGQEGPYPPADCLHGLVPEWPVRHVQRAVHCQAINGYQIGVLSVVTWTLLCSAVSMAVAIRGGNSSPTTGAVLYQSCHVRPVGYQPERRERCDRFG